MRSERFRQNSQKTLLERMEDLEDKMVDIKNTQEQILILQKNHFREIEGKLDFLSKHLIYCTAVGTAVVVTSNTNQTEKLLGSIDDIREQTKPVPPLSLPIFEENG